VTAPVDELYFKWLYRQVGSVRERNPSRSYFELMKQLHQKEFHWFVPNDHNRVEDGRDLRIRFVHYSGITPDSAWMGLGCSFFEMLLGLSHRLSFEDGGPPREWFWRLIENLGMEDLNDANYGDQTYEAVDEVLERVMWRQYAPDGSGGLFPLKHPEKDQREVEIWYQLCAYLLDS
jgi:hypothetical protein